MVEFRFKKKSDIHLKLFTFFNLHLPAYLNPEILQTLYATIMAKGFECLARGCV